MIEKKKGGRPTKRPNPELLAVLYQGHTAREIADMYDIKKATVYSWINRIRAKER